MTIRSSDDTVRARIFFLELEKKKVFMKHENVFGNVFLAS